MGLSRRARRYLRLLRMGVRLERVAAVDRGRFRFRTTRTGAHRVARADRGHGSDHDRRRRVRHRCTDRRAGALAGTGSDPAVFARDRFLRCRGLRARGRSPRRLGCSTRSIGRRLDPARRDGPVGRLTHFRPGVVRRGTDCRGRGLCACVGRGRCTRCLTPRIAQPRPDAAHRNARGPSRGSRRSDHQRRAGGTRSTTPRTALRTRTGGHRSTSHGLRRRGYQHSRRDRSGACRRRLAPGTAPGLHRRITSRASHRR